MHSRFIKLYDDNGYEYIVNMDKITCVDVAGKKSLGRWKDHAQHMRQEHGLPSQKAGR